MLPLVSPTGTSSRPEVTEATSAASAGVPLLTAHQEGLEKSLDENFVIRTYEIHRALFQAAKPSVASVFYTRVRVQV